MWAAMSHMYLIHIPACKPTDFPKSEKEATTKQEWDFAFIDFASYLLSRKSSGGTLFLLPQPRLLQDRLKYK